jgi:predicted dehydrogenase
LEKPAALTADDYREMLAAAYANSKFILDGTMFPHHKRTNDVLGIITDESKVGKVDRIECDFSFMGEKGFDDSNIRASKEGDPHGCIGDLGWYCIRYALMVFGKLGSGYKSSRVVDFKLNKHRVPVDATCVVQFEGVSWSTRWGDSSVYDSIPEFLPCDVRARCSGSIVVLGLGFGRGLRFVGLRSSYLLMIWFFLLINPQSLYWAHLP